MTDRNGRKPDGAEKLVRDIRRATRRQYSAEEKIQPSSWKACATGT